MVFFSRKKSKSSNPNSSNSPTASDKKKSKFLCPNRSAISVFARVASKRRQAKDGSKSKGKEVSSEVHSSTPGKSNLASSSKAQRQPPSEGLRLPILSSSISLNGINTRSSPLPQASFFSFSNDNKANSGINLSKSGSGNTKKEAGSSGTSSKLEVEVNLDLKSSDTRPLMPESGTGMASNAQNSCELENPKESESPHYQASAPRKRFPGDIKSYSHELNSNGVRPFPLWKLHRPNNFEEITKIFRTKFDKAKEEVNKDLAVFGGKLADIITKNAESHPDLRVTIEDMLILASKCAKTTSGEFWLQCEGIVQDLDDRRQEFPPGLLKKLHTELLFILTRCTRLLQFHKESWGQEKEAAQQDRDGRGSNAAKALKIAFAKKAYSQEQCGLNWKEDFSDRLAPLSAPYNETSKDSESPTNIDKMSSWKRLPSLASKGLKESAVSREQDDNKTEPPKVVKNRVAMSDNMAAIAKLPECPPSKLSYEHMSMRRHNLYWGYWGDQSCSSEERSIICRICEEEVPTTYVEDHSRICALADKYDQKSLSVDERLVAIAVTLDKITETFIQKDSLAAVESPDSMKISNASLIEESDVLSPKLSDLSRRGSEEMLECFPEADNSALMDDMRCLTSMSCRTRSGPKSDQGMATSSAGSMTPRTPIRTPRTDPIEFLLGGKGAFSDQDDIPQMIKLADIARCAANAIQNDDQSVQLLLSCLEDLRVAVDCRKFDALIVETFGTRIEKLIKEKYLQMCELLDDENLDLSSTVIDENAPLEDDVVCCLRTSPVHLQDRTSIDDFTLIKEISRGAFGRVCLASKITTGDLFAIKILKKADMIRKNAVESILAERDILINVYNPFVVRFFYSFTSRESLYLVMEYLNGGDIYSMLKKLGCLYESNARVYIAEVVLALEYLHSEGIVHRDLKPDNLLIAHDGHVKLTDFGLSKVGLINSTDDLSGPVHSVLVEEKPKSPTSKHQVERRDKRSAVGTPDYLAPEILLGTRHGASADWWSVGIILFELITGLPPFNADNPQEIFYNILNRNIPWPDDPNCMSHEAYDLIDRLLTADPHQRLGARGAAEVKQHAFFKDINWHTLAEQKAAFVPDSDNALDTSYFECRYPSNFSDEQCCQTNENEDSSDSDSDSSNHHNKGVDESAGPSESEASTSESNPFDNFSYKNLTQLAYINYDVVAKTQKDGAQPSKHRR